MRRTFLFLMIGSLSFAALLGVSVLLFSYSLGRTATCVLLTSLTITLFSIISLACAWSWEQDRRRGIAIAGMIFSSLSFVVYEAMIWGEQYMRWEWEERVGKTMAIGTIWAGLMGLLCLLGLARIRRNWAWVNKTTQILAVILTIVGTPAIILEMDEEPMGRVLGILGILTACGAICVPILHRLSAMPVEDAVVTTTLTLGIICPRCNTQQEVPAGRSKCGKCGLRFNVEIEEENCPKCGYVLYKLTSDRCPECGTPISEPTEVSGL